MTFVHRIHDLATGEIKDIPFTKEEIEEANKIRLELEETDLKTAKLEAEKISAKNALLAKLGITEEEAKLLLG